MINKLISGGAAVVGGRCVCVLPEHNGAGLTDTGFLLTSELYQDKTKGVCNACDTDLNFYLFFMPLS